MPFVVRHVVCSFLLDLLHVLTRADHDKDLELLLLRQQLRLYERQARQPRPSRWEQVALASLAARLPDLSRVALIFTPATLLRWHREIVRRTWTFGNCPRRGRPPVSAACVELIVRLARENPRWGYGKVQGELAKLGHRVSRSTIKRVLRQHQPPPAPERGTSTWRAFLGHYRESRVACDFFTVDTLFLQRLYVLVFLELGSRRLHFAGCTAALDAAWVTQQARQFSWHLQDGDPGAIKFLIHDRDSKFAAGFDTVFASEGIAVIKAPAQGPNANAYAERVIRSVRAECLDHLRILSQRHLVSVLRHYVAYYNRRRLHQGLGQALPAPLAPAPTAPAAPAQVSCRPVLSWIVHDYAVAA